MEKIYHYSISLHTEKSPNNNLVKAHEKNAVFIGPDFKPTIGENHLIVGSFADGEAIAVALLPSLKEKYGPKTHVSVGYTSVLGTDKQQGRVVEHKAIIEEFLSSLK